jgi:acyl dehydratase
MALGFDDFWPGRELDGGSRTISTADIRAFAELSGDHNPLHLDEAYARSTPFGGCVAHGALGIAVATGLLATSGLTRGSLIALLGIDWRFEAPIRPGDTVHLRLRVAERRLLADGVRGLVTFAAELAKADGTVVQRGEIRELLHSTPPASRMPESADT